MADEGVIRGRSGIWFRWPRSLFSHLRARVVAQVRRCKTGLGCMWQHY